MKHFLIALSLAALAASGAAAQAPRKEKPAPKAKPAAVVLPADAEKVAEGVWRARDAQGRIWIYKRTPFGLTRYEEAAAAPETPAGTSGIRVREAGESRVVFEKATPFGLRTWTKNPQELDAEEREALENWRKQARKQD
ncbi:MAG: hypothetical protein N2036_01030 [Bryobacteraceae bacterium]|nr:hypothetical protein [Bryobacteraceae bacterium]